MTLSILVRLLVGIVIALRSSCGKEILSVDDNGNIRLSSAGNLVITAGNQSSGTYSAGVKIQDSPLIRSWSQLKVI